jgi:hypothetical protein
MSFQNTHFVQEFVPTYTVKSEYLPTNRVVDANQGQTAEWVWDLLLFLAQKIWRTKKSR